MTILKWLGMLCLAIVFTPLVILAITAILSETSMDGRKWIVAIPVLLFGGGWVIGMWSTLITGEA